MKSSWFGSAKKNIKYTGFKMYCPLCHNTTELVKCKSMRWCFMRCQVCLLAYNSKIWNELKLKQTIQIEEIKK